MIGRLVVCNLLTTQLLAVFIACEGGGYLGEEGWQAKNDEVQPGSGLS